MANRTGNCRGEKTIVFTNLVTPNLRIYSYIFAEHDAAKELFHLQ